MILTYPKILKHRLDDLDSKAHSHVPWICILIQQLQAWRDSHDGKMPTSRDEKKEFKQSVRELARGGLVDIFFIYSFQILLFFLSFFFGLNFFLKKNYFFFF